ncbi:MAG: hypothetical protein HONBIEJF_01481 [Fimbriimonadaceae bacterium]|nr:hypothetical protein [Fimbriimonadaceae bacterium]
MRKAFGLAFLFGLLALVQSAFAQEGTYRLQPEDIIRIQVMGEQQINAQLPVGRDGNVTAPFLGPIRAAGKTVSELEADLTAAYIQKLRFREPRVSVTIESFRAVRVAIGGAVTRAGVYSIRPTDTILTLINLGGGLAGGADQKRATLKRGQTRELIPIDLQAMLLRGDLSQNYVLQDGDELMVPEDVRARVLVVGAVARPGIVAYRDPMTVMDALSFSGGEIPNRSWLSRTVVLREQPGNPGQYLRIPANIIRFLDHAEASQNVILQAGDIVFVPKTRTPDWNQLATIFNTIFFADRFIQDNALGIRIFR